MLQPRFATMTGRSRTGDRSHPLLFWHNVAITVTVAFTLLYCHAASAQAGAANPAGNAADLAGPWQGTLHAGQDLRVVFTISKSGDGYKAIFHSIDQGIEMPATITMDGSSMKMTLASDRVTYQGKLSTDGQAITGTWIQGPNNFPLTLSRATPQTEWTIPTLPPVLRMDQNASPAFEVATIKPSKPDESKKYLLLGRRQFKVVNYNLDELVTFAYGLHPKQVLGSPPWAETDKFDIVGEPDREGVPSIDQWKTMLQKLLAERCQLSFHRDRREMPVYILSVSKTGPRLATSLGNAMGLPGMGFRSGVGGDIAAFNASINDFINFFTRNVKLDRPILNQTGLTGRYDFTLDWSPDDSQFNGMAITAPPNKTNPPPNLYVALQEQLGLKLTAAKAMADVYVLDRVEKPSAN